MISKSGSDGREIASDRDFMQALGVESRQGVLDVIDDKVEPLMLFDPEWFNEGFRVIIGNTVLDLEYPFSLDDFWREMREVEESATRLRDGQWRIQALEEIATLADAAGAVYATTVGELATACQMALGSRLSADQKRQIEAHLSDFGFDVAELPTMRDQWTVLWRSDSPVAVTLSGLSAQGPAR